MPTWTAATTRWKDENFAESWLFSLSSRRSLLFDVVFYLTSIFIIQALPWDFLMHEEFLERVY